LTIINKYYLKTVLDCKLTALLCWA